MAKQTLRLLASVGISLLILWLLFRLVNDQANPVSLGDITTLISNIPVSVYLLYLGIHFIGVVVRTVRFRLLVRAAGGGVVPGFVPMALVTLVRNMTVDMLPSRTGELFYVALLNRGLGVRLESCFSSLALSIWFDVMVIIPLVCALLLFPVLDAGIQQRMLVFTVFLILVCIIGMLILYPGIGIAARLLGRFSSDKTSLLGRFHGLVQRFSEDVSNSLDRNTVIKTFLLTVVVRLCKYSSIVILFLAVAAAGFPEISREAHPVSVLIALLASEASASLPIPAFMSFGTYEAGGMLAFSMLGMPVAAAGLVLFCVHVITQIVDYLVGGIAFVLFLLKTGMKPTKDWLTQQGNEPSARS